MNKYIDPKMIDPKFLEKNPIFGLNDAEIPGGSNDFIYSIGPIEVPMVDGSKVLINSSGEILEYR